MSLQRERAALSEALEKMQDELIQSEERCEIYKSQLQAMKQLINHQKRFWFFILKFENRVLLIKGISVNLLRNYQKSIRLLRNIFICYVLLSSSPFSLHSLLFIILSSKGHLIGLSINSDLWLVNIYVPISEFVQSPNALDYSFKKPEVKIFDRKSIYDSLLWLLL